MNNQLGFNTGVNVGLNGRLTGNTVSETINNIETFKNETQKKYGDMKTQELEESAKAMTESGARTSDPKIMNMNFSGANSAYMELIIKQAALAAGHTEYEKLGTGEILPYYLEKNPSQMQNTIQAQKGLMNISVWAKKNGLDVPQGEVQSFAPVEIKGKSFGSKLFNYGVRPILDASAVAEGLGWGMIGAGNWLENKTLNTTTPEDVNREARYVKYEDLPETYQNRINQYEAELYQHQIDGAKNIEEIQANLDNAIANGQSELIEQYETQLAEEKRIYDYRERELKAKIDSAKERMEEVIETKKTFPEGKPETVRETIKEIAPKGSDASAAGTVGQNAELYYTSEIKPYFKMSSWKGDPGDIILSITKEDIGPGKTRTEWAEIQKMMKRDAARYSKDFGETTLEILHDEVLPDFDLSQSRLKGETPQGLEASYKDAVHTKMRNIINQTLEAENPGKGMSEKMYKYSNMKIGEGQLKTNAVKDSGRRLNNSIKQDVRDVVNQPKIKRGLGVTLKKWGEKIKPSTYIMRKIDEIKNNKNAAVEKGQQIAESSKVNSTNASQPKLINSTAGKEIIKKIETAAENSPKKGINPKVSTQPSLFGSSADFAGIFVAEELYKAGLDLPLDVVTEIVSYALETNKLNREGNRDLPLYDAENSYQNNNPNYGKLSEYMPDTSLYEQDWWKALLEEEAKLTKDYRENMSDVDVEDVINSVK